jgi:hypothetical protein
MVIELGGELLTNLSITFRCRVLRKVMKNHSGWFSPKLAETLSVRLLPFLARTFRKYPPKLGNIPDAGKPVSIAI